MQPVPPLSDSPRSVADLMLSRPAPAELWLIAAPGEPRQPRSGRR
jgi:hypothetical protein